MKIGKIEIAPVDGGLFSLDGGAMFGIIPKVLWSKFTPVDRENRIPLASTPLLVKTAKEIILVDTGLGDKYDERTRKIYDIHMPNPLIDSLARLGVMPEDVDTVICTHMHFDHVGGNTIIKDRQPVPAFPNARYIVQRGEWEAAAAPNERTRASYLPENILPLEKHGQLELVEGDTEIAPGVKCVVTGGHTKHHQVVMIESEGEAALYLADLVPTASHVNKPYIMGYDLYPLETLEKKKELLPRAEKGGWTVLFAHDVEVKAAKLKTEGRKYVIENITTAKEEKD